MQYREIVTQQTMVEEADDMATITIIGARQIFLEIKNVINSLKSE